MEAVVVDRSAYPGVRVALSVAVLVSEEVSVDSGEALCESCAEELPELVAGAEADRVPLGVMLRVEVKLSGSLGYELLVALVVPVKVAEGEGEAVPPPPPLPREGVEAGVGVAMADALTEAVAVPVVVAQGVPVAAAEAEMEAVAETVSEPPPPAATPPVVALWEKVGEGDWVMEGLPERDRTKEEEALGQRLGEPVPETELETDGERRAEADLPPVLD